MTEHFTREKVRHHPTHVSNLEQQLSEDHRAVHNASFGTQNVTCQPRTSAHQYHSLFMRYHYHHDAASRLHGVSSASTNLSVRRPLRNRNRNRNRIRIRRRASPGLRASTHSRRPPAAVSSASAVLMDSTYAGLDVSVVLRNEEKDLLAATPFSFRSVDNYPLNTLHAMQ